MSLGMPTNKKAPVRRLFEPEPLNSDYIVNSMKDKAEAKLQDWERFNN